MDEDVWGLPRKMDWSYYRQWGILYLSLLVV